MYVAALDQRIDGVLISGYFQEREAVLRRTDLPKCLSQLVEFEMRTSLR
jgi:hypothetical protein